MKKILVTGFTGNTGHEVALHLQRLGEEFVCAVRDINKAKAKFREEFQYTTLDYDKTETFETALTGVDRIFLMFPPETKYEPFHAFIQLASEKKIKHLVYLSVKDVQYMPFIPHYKNEKAIAGTGIPYTFLRAGYFMQNLNLFLLDELKQQDRIYVPAGKGKTSFTNVQDIAEIAALALKEGGKHLNQKYALTGSESVDFYEVARRMTAELGRTITYSNPSAKEFKRYMLTKNLPKDYLNVVIGLHFVTKIGLAGGRTDMYTDITGKPPTQLNQYLHDYRDYWV